MTTTRYAIRRRLREEEGLATTELAVLMPFLLALVLLPIQFGLYWHGQQAADAAAEECVDAAQALNADIVGDGTNGARAILSQAGNLTNVSIAPTSTGTNVICTVTGNLNFSIFGTRSVAARAEGPIEQFIAEDDR